MFLTIYKTMEPSF